MLTYYPIGPLEDQTYIVAHKVPGTKTDAVDIEHLNENDAISEARRLNDEAKKAEAQTQVERQWRLRGVGEH